MKESLNLVFLVAFAIFNLSGVSPTPEDNFVLGCFPVEVPTTWTKSQLDECYPFSHINENGLYYGKDSTFRDLILYWPVDYPLDSIGPNTLYWDPYDISKDSTFNGLALVRSQFYPDEEVNQTFPGLSMSSDELSKKARQAHYIEKYCKIAKAEQVKYGIPTSITLAQGILESGAGNSELARKANNHFGIKCFKRRCPDGHCINRKDDHHKDFFVVYNSVWESYRAHSKVLMKDRYKPLFKLDPKDYRAWAHGLKKAGYATDKRYAQKLINLIEDLELYQYD